MNLTLIKVIDIGLTWLGLKDIDHKKPLRSGGSNAKSNTRVRSRSANRADNGKTGGRKPKRKG